MRAGPGVAEVNSWGGLEKEYQVRIDPVRLLRHEISFDAVVDAVRPNNLNVGGGNINENQTGDMLLVHGIGRTSTVEQIENIVITASEGVPIHVRDVADVTIGHEFRNGAVTANGQGEVVLGLGFMLMGENSYAVTQPAQGQARTKSRPRCRPTSRSTTVYDRTRLVDQVIATVRSNLFDGALLVTAILFIFLGNLRAGLIVALAIPLSMLFAFSGMLQMGIAGTLLSLGAIDFGIVVDSSLVVIENILRAHRPRTATTTASLVRDATIEVRQPTIFGQLIIMIVYLPILTLEGVEGKMFRPWPDRDLRADRLADPLADADARAGQLAAAAARSTRTIRWSCGSPSGSTSRCSSGPCSSRWPCWPSRPAALAGGRLIWRSAWAPSSCRGCPKATSWSACCGRPAPHLTESIAINYADGAVAAGALSRRNLARLEPHRRAGGGHRCRRRAGVRHVRLAQPARNLDQGHARKPTWSA